MGIACQSCGQTFRWKPHMAGKQIACRCGAWLTIPETKPAENAPRDLPSDLLEPINDEAKVEDQTAVHEVPPHIQASPPPPPSAPGGATKPVVPPRLPARRADVHRPESRTTSAQTGGHAASGPPPLPARIRYAPRSEEARSSRKDESRQGERDETSNKTSRAGKAFRISLALTFVSAIAVTLWFVFSGPAIELEKPPGSGTASIGVNRVAFVNFDAATDLSRAEIIVPTGDLYGGHFVEFAGLASPYLVTAKPGYLVFIWPDEGSASAIQGFPIRESDAESGLDDVRFDVASTVQRNLNAKSVALEQPHIQFFAALGNVSNVYVATVAIPKDKTSIARATAFINEAIKRPRPLFHSLGIMALMRAIPGEPDPAWIAWLIDLVEKDPQELRSAAERKTNPLLSDLIQKRANYIRHEAAATLAVMTDFKETALVIRGLNKSGYSMPVMRALRACISERPPNETTLDVFMAMLEKVNQPSMRERLYGLIFDVEMPLRISRFITRPNAPPSDLDPPFSIQSRRQRPWKLWLGGKIDPALAKELATQSDDALSAIDPASDRVVPLFTILRGTNETLVPKRLVDVTKRAGPDAIALKDAWKLLGEMGWRRADAQIFRSKMSPGYWRSKAKESIHEVIELVEEGNYPRPRRVPMGHLILDSVSSVIAYDEMPILRRIVDERDGFMATDLYRQPVRSTGSTHSLKQTRDSKALFAMMKSNDVEGVRKYFKDGGKYDAIGRESSEKIPPLLDSIRRNHFEMARVLLENGVSANDPANRTVYYSAMVSVLARNDYELFKLLVKSGAPLFGLSRGRSWSVMGSAARGDDGEIVRWLLEDYGLDPNKDIAAFRSCVQVDKVETVELLLKHGLRLADLPADVAYDTLVVAAKNRSTKMMDVLLTNKLHEVSKAPAVSDLSRLRAPYDAQNLMEWTVVMDDVAMLELFHKHGLTYRGRESIGKHAVIGGPTGLLYIAMLQDSFQVAEWAIKQGADVNAEPVPKNGPFLARMMLSRDKTPWIIWLLEHTVKTHARAVGNRYIADLARPESGLPDAHIVQSFLKDGLIDKDSDAYLYYLACASTKVDELHARLDQGLDPNRTVKNFIPQRLGDREQHVPLLKIAMHGRNKPALELLLKRKMSKDSIRATTVYATNQFRVGSSPHRWLYLWFVDWMRKNPVPR